MTHILYNDLFYDHNDCESLTIHCPVVHLYTRVDHISQKFVKQYSKLFIPFLDMRIDTKENCSSIRDELGVAQAPFSFSCGLRGEFHQNIDFTFLLPEAFSTKWHMIKGTSSFFKPEIFAHSYNPIMIWSPCCCCCTCFDKKT